MHARLLGAALAVLLCAGAALAAPATPQGLAADIYPVGQLPPTDSTLAVAVGQAMPDFDLPAVSGGRVRLSDYLGKKNLVLSFVPAAWTPVCSGQWPGYNIAKEAFEANDATLVGISADNIPTLYAWIKEMGGLWFPVASDFWPHGGLARKLGILRSNGVTERALFVVDKKGVIRFIDVHDINTRPDLGQLLTALARVHKEQ